MADASQLRESYIAATREQLENGMIKIKHCVGQLDDVQLWWRPEGGMNSIANLLIHLAGNLRQWFVCGLGELEDDRQRQEEFDDRSMRTATELLLQLESTLAESYRTISQATSEDLLRIRRVQEWDVTGFQAIQDSATHFQGHVQEIIHMTRRLKGKDYQFFFVPKDQATTSLSSSRDHDATDAVTLTGSTVIEDQRQELQRLKRNADRALADISDENFWREPKPDGLHAESVTANPVALIVKHVAGNLRSRWSDFLDADGEKSDRHRDQEFVRMPEDTRDSLMQAWEEGWRILDDTLASLSDVQLSQTVTIRQEPHSVHQAIVRSLSHTALHVGQIVFLRRALQPESPWLTIAPGESDAVRGRYLR